MNTERSCPRSLKSRFLADVPRKVFSSRFFTISALLHFILVLVFGGTVLVRTTKAPEDFPQAQISASDDSTEAANRPPSGNSDPAETVLPPVQIDSSHAAINLIRTDNLLHSNEIAPVRPVFPTSGAVLPVARGPFETSPTNLPTTRPGELSPEQKQAIKVFTTWTPPGSRGGSVKDRIFQFTIFLAKYGDPNDPQRGGDWASTHRLKDGKITGGSLPNLVYLMNKMSNGKLQASLASEPIDLASGEIFAKRPPFIFFTGHRDFVLTEREVENLQKYVSLGGCIWGDSSLPGRRSRFDIAFRREMRRVVGDIDKQWETLPSNHAMFTQNLYYPEVKTMPAGLNFYKEPIHALKYQGEVAVIYTANDYADLWQIGLDEHGKLDFSTDERGNYVAMNHAIWNRRDIYFRNVAESPVLNSYKFGANVVAHLLTRWEGRLGRTPTGL